MMSNRKYQPDFSPAELAGEKWRRCQAPLVRYEVSSLGRIRHARRKQPLQLKINNWGYLTISVRQNKSYKTVLIHHQVAFSFCEGWREGLQVNHKDGNKHNNRAENLEWVTASENMRHAAYCLRKRVKAVGLFDGSRLKYLFSSTQECNRLTGGNVRVHVQLGVKYHGYRPRYIPENIYRETLFNMKVLDMPLRQAYIEAATQLYFDQQEKGGEV